MKPLDQQEKKMRVEQGTKSARERVLPTEAEAFEHSGFRCEVRRMPEMGHWCGYVTVPAGHPWHGKHYDEIGDVDVHGGLTFGAPEEDGPGFVYGFDCAHHGDIVPGVVGLMAGLGSRGGTYRTKEYTMAETRKLADQARAVLP